SQRPRLLATNLDTRIVGRVNGLVLELGMAEGALPREKAIHRIDEGLIRAVISRQTKAKMGRIPGLEIDLEVGAAERVDGLLGVADEPERLFALVEDGAEDRPLHRVGVLELVDERD